MGRVCRVGWERTLEEENVVHAVAWGHAEGQV